MLMRNPQRRYMVNAPLPDMEMIIANSLPPKSVFIGMRNDKIVYDQFYFLKNVFSKQFNPEPFESFLDKRPPIISRSFSSGKYFMSFFEPKTDEKWLEIDKIKDDQTYNWIFQSAFSPAGEAKHFIAVDLKALAECKPLDSDLSLDNFSKEVSTMKDPEK
jgi:hypothetical protein